jgi:hypothetical protein
MLRRDVRILLLPVLAASRIENGLEQLVELAGKQRMADQRVGDVALSVRSAGLAQVTSIGAQHRDLPACQTRGKHQSVIGIIVAVPVPNGHEGVFEDNAVVLHRDFFAGLALDLHFVQPDDVAELVGDIDGIGQFADNAKAHVLEKRNAFRQRDRRTVVVDAQAGFLVRLSGRAEEIDVDGIFRREPGDALQVLHGLGRQHRVAISFGKTGIAQYARRRADALGHQLLEEMILPRAGDRLDLRFEPGLFRFRRLALAAADDEVHARQCAFREGRVISRNVAVVAGREIFGDPCADRGIVAVARHEDDDRDKAVERIDAGKDTHSRPLGKLRRWLGRFLSAWARRSGRARRADRIPARSSAPCRSGSPDRIRRVSSRRRSWSADRECASPSGYRPSR